MTGWKIGAGLTAAVLSFAAPAWAAEKVSVEKSVGSTAAKLPTLLDSQALNAMLRADRDKDGSLSREELDHYDVTLGRRFKEADGDRDGKLTLYEFEKLLGPPQTAASRR